MKILAVVVFVVVSICSSWSREELVHICSSKEKDVIISIGDVANSDLETINIVVDGEVITKDTKVEKAEPFRSHVPGWEIEVEVSEYSDSKNLNDDGINYFQIEKGVEISDWYYAYIRLDDGRIFNMIECVE
ncbi:MAG: hypothetical protein H6621_06915 [Halobacteriovoraceae bacterium]|nr:hypothetical protein [Halobacteriovoraceae bacterium]